MNMIWNRLAVASLLGLALGLSACRSPAVNNEVAEPVHRIDWYSVLLEGRKIGHARMEQRRDGERVVSQQLLSFEMGRSGVNITMTSQDMHEETLAGEPLSFSSSSHISGLEMRVEGQRIGPGRFAVKSGSVDSLRESQMDWPDGAVLAWGSEIKLHEAGTIPGTTVDVLSFQPMLQTAVVLHHEVIGPARIDLPGEGATDVTEARQTMRFPTGEMVSRVWMGQALNLRKVTLDMMGQTLELLACDEACATAPNQPVEILTSSLVAVPQALTGAEQAGPWQVDLHSTVALSDWPGIDGQRLQALGGDRYRLETDHAQGDPIEPPQPRDLLVTDWLDHDAPGVQALLLGVQREGDALTVMNRLETVVRSHIDNKNLSIGYASASDAARLREGDCTEHAVLLAALGRAAGIPSRVVSGLAYSEDYGDGPSLVPHAWVTAWTGERWQAFDAAYPGRQLRIALHADDGDPWRFYDNLEALNRIRIESIGLRQAESVP